MPGDGGARVRQAFRFPRAWGRDSPPENDRKNQEPEPMKLISAIIKPFKLDDVRAAIARRMKKTTDGE